GGVPWHFTDESTGEAINAQTYPTFWQNGNNTGQYWSPLPANGWPNSASDPWTPDAAHMPDLNYVAYMVTGSHYQLELLQAEANYAITSTNPYYLYNSGDTVNPTNPGNAIYMGVASPHHQERAIAWGIREVAEAAYATPDSDPAKA